MTEEIKLRSNRKNLTGQKFGKLTVIKPVKTINDTSRWLCKCECGNEKVVATYRLLSGRVTTCGDCFNTINFYIPEILRLEQENKALKDIIDDGRAENKRFREENDELKKTVENQKLEYEELQCDLLEVENACGCYQSENAELKQENKELKIYIESNKQQVEEAEMLVMDNDRLQQEVENLKDTIYYDVEKYRSALEEIREYCNRIERGEVIGTQDCLINSIKNIVNYTINEN